MPDPRAPPLHARPSHPSSTWLHPTRSCSGCSRHLTGTHCSPQLPSPVSTPPTQDSLRERPQQEVWARLGAGAVRGGAWVPSLYFLWCGGSSLGAVPWGVHTTGAFPGGSDGKESACKPGDVGSIPGSGRPPGEGNGYPLQYSCLENPMDRGAWQAAVHGVAKELDTTEKLTISLHTAP